MWRHVDHANQRALRQVLGGDVVPGCAAIAGDVYESIVGASPEDAWLVWRFYKAKIVA